MPRRFEVLTEFDHLPELGNRLQRAMQDGIKKAILDIETREKAKIVANDQVDTGNMLNSCYSQMTGEATGEAGNTASYAINQELGYKGIAGRPFLLPAFNETVPEITEYLRRVADSE